LPLARAADALDAKVEAAAGGDANSIDDLRRYIRQELQSGQPVPDKLVAALRQLAAKDAAKPAAKRPLAHFEDRLLLVSAVGLQESAPAAQRVLYLMDSGDDAPRLAALAQEALHEEESLRHDLDEAIEAARGDWELLAIGLPRKLQEVRDQGEYRAAWVRLYLAAAQVAARGQEAARAEEAEILNPAVTAARQQMKNDGDVQDRLAATLLAGMALWRQGQLEQARPLLEQAATVQSPARTRLQAMFELARIDEQQGRWAQARGRIDEFSKQGRQLLGESSTADIELHAAFFLNHMLRRQARAAARDSAAEAQALDKQAQQALADVLVRYPQRLGAAAPLIGTRYGQRDVMELETPLAAAVGLYRLAGSPPDRPGAMACLAQVLARSAAQDKLFHPAALWNLGACLYAIGGEQADGWPARHRAAGCFAQLAEQFSDDPAALAAAQNAVAILQWRLSGVEGTAEAPALRGELIAALETLLAHWGDRAEFRPHALALARQYEQAGQFEKALAAYGRIPSDWPDYLPAWNGRLILRRRLLTEGGRPAAAGPAQVLLGEMRQFVAAARTQAQRVQADDPATAQKLFSLAADCDLRIAEILKEELASPAPALAHLDELEACWAKREEVLQRAGALRVEILLAQNQLGRAAAILRDRHGRLGDAEEVLVWRTAGVIRQRLGELDLSPGGADDVVTLRSALRQCAEQASAIAEQAGQLDYAHRQLLAESWIETGRPAEALKLFDELSAQRADDARNFQGQARCHWLAGRHSEAIELYRRLSEGLSPAEQGPLWWRIQLDMARCIRDAAGGRPEPLERLGVRIRQLATMDPNLGGYRRAFEEIVPVNKENTKTTKTPKSTKEK
jgi:tetratricopeptide (TPR) repeat protein